MPTRRLLLSCILLLAAFLPARAETGPWVPLAASAPCFRYEGRVDRREPSAPVLIWSGTRVLADFSGPRLALRFGPAVDQSVFDVTVDGATEIVDIRAGAGSRYVWPQALTDGRHRLVVFKRSEAAKGHVAFAGLEYAGGATWVPEVPAARVRFEFFGDSITAGACNEDGATDQWDDFRTHNHALSYAHLVSQACAADHRAMAVSGMGVSTGWVEVKAGEVWDKLYPQPDSPRVDLAAWQPDVAFVNLGENDTSYSAAQGRPFPVDFASRYVALVQAIRAAYPDAHIVLLRGGMGGGKKDANLRAAWEHAVGELERADPKVGHYVFEHWSELHPRVSDDRAMAAELVAWLERQSFLVRWPARPVPLAQ